MFCIDTNVLQDSVLEGWKSEGWKSEEAIPKLRVEGGCVSVSRCRFQGWKPLKKKMIFLAKIWFLDYISLNLYLFKLIHYCLLSDCEKLSVFY